MAKCVYMDYNSYAAEPGQCVTVQVNYPDRSYGFYFADGSLSALENKQGYGTDVVAVWRIKSIKNRDNCANDN